MLTDIEIREIAKKLDDKGDRHTFYKESIDIASKIKETFSDKYPSFLKKTRPKETKKDANYREAIFENPVKGDRSRILNKITKIEQSEDFLVNYPLNENSKNELMDYCENDFNGSKTLINWIFTLLINYYADDPNSVLVVLDKNPPERESQGYKPYPYLFESENVIFYEKNKYCVVVEKDSIEINNNIYYIIDDTNYYILKQNSSFQKIIIDYITVPHFCSEPPFKKIGLYIVQENSKGEVYFKSILSDTLPHFNKAIARSIDAELEFAHHIHTLEWQMAPKKCPKCKGQKVITLHSGEKESCETCDGKGILNWGVNDLLYIDMFEDKYLDGKSSFPFNAPGGFVPRNIETLKELKSSYNDSIDSAYDAIDFGILRRKDVNSAESGLSKQYNRLEYSQRIYTEGRHIIENILLFIYLSIDRQLFGVRTDGNLNRIPEITVPISFDVMSPEMVLAEIKIAKEAGVNAKIRLGLEIKYSKLVFGDNSRETKMLEDEYYLNPLLGMTSDDILSLFGGGKGTATNGINELDFIIGSNFKSFIDKANRQFPKWHDQDYNQKFNILSGYANESITQKTPIVSLPSLQVA